MFAHLACTYIYTRDVMCDVYCLYMLCIAMAVVRHAGYNSCAQVLVLPALQQEEQQSRTNMVSGSAFDRDRSL